MFVRTWDSETLKFRSLILKAGDHCANSFQRSRLRFSISDNSPTSRFYVTLVISLPCSSVHCWHSCLLTVLQLPNRAYPCLHTFPTANTKPAKVLFVKSVLCQLLRVQCGALSSLLLPTSAGGTWGAPAQTPRWFLKQSNVYQSIASLFLPHKNHPEIAI